MKHIKIILVGLIVMMLSSCLTVRGQEEYVVYYDYVISGLVYESGYVNDGFRSYHLVTEIPKNRYWVLRPVGRNVYIYNRTRTHKQVYYPKKTWVFYNKSRQREYRPVRGQSYYRPPVPKGHKGYGHHRHYHTR